MLEPEYPTKLKFIRTEETEGLLVFHFALESDEPLKGAPVSGAVRIALEAGMLPKRPLSPATPSGEVWLQLQARFEELVRFSQDCAYPKPQNPREQE